MAPGTLQAQASSGTLSRADASYTTLSASGSRTHYAQQYDPATILKVPHGQKYLPGPLGASMRRSSSPWPRRDCAPWPCAGTCPSIW